MKEFAKPIAIELLKEDIFWDTYNEFAPFGSDEGWISFLRVKDFLAKNPQESIFEYTLEQYDSADYQDFETNNAIILEDTDWYIIAIPFAQFILQGFVEAPLKKFALMAFERQMSERVLRYFMYEDYESWEERTSILKKLLHTLQALPESVEGSKKVYLSK